MEPANLNDRTPEDERLAALLRPTATGLPDNGFTARVLAALPPEGSQPASRPHRAHWLAGILGGLAGLGVVWWQSARVPELGETEPHPLAVALGQIGTVVSDPWFSAALALIVLSLGIAYLSYSPRWRLR